MVASVRTRPPRRWWSSSCPQLFSSFQDSGISMVIADIPRLYSRIRFESRGAIMVIRPFINSTSGDYVQASDWQDCAEKGYLLQSVGVWVSPRLNGYEWLYTGATTRTSIRTRGVLLGLGLDESPTRTFSNPPTYAFHVLILDVSFNFRGTEGRTFFTVGHLQSHQDAADARTV